MSDVVGDEFERMARQQFDVVERMKRSICVLRYCIAAALVVGLGAGLALARLPWAWIFTECSMIASH